jgi:hypothetical protein
VTEQYLSLKETAERLRISPKTLKNKMAAGIFRKGVHFFSPPGLGPRFKWSAVVSFIEGEQKPAESEADSIPMARGYELGKPNLRQAG